MYQTKILRIALPTPLRRLFDYLPPEGIDSTTLKAGIRVKVPFQSRQLVGILVEVTDQTALPEGKLKRALEILDEDAILSDEIYKLCTFASDYYHYSLGEVLASAIPVYLRKGKSATITKKKNKEEEIICEDILPNLNNAQEAAITSILTAQEKFQTFLLNGVTGSGKTEVYLRVIDAVLKNQQQVLVLVPEISLTPQTIERFRARFKTSIVALHSNVSDKARMQIWNDAKEGRAQIVIGTRSAIFTPFPNLGLIIIDEEHDSSFKQQDRFRYHARDLAVMRAQLKQIPIVLGSATPSLESLLNVKRNRYEELMLPERAGNAVLPTYEMIDLLKEEVHEGLSKTLIDKMRAELNADNQVLLFLNRRGFAPVLFCTECAYIIPCGRCAVRMVYHQKPARLHCHHCDARERIPHVCPHCHNQSLQPIGIGTQRLEETLQQYFPDIPIIRVDRDNTKNKGALDALFAQIHTEKKAILLGTQMLAKGHHFPNVTLVGIIDADAGLFSADFRAAEHMGQLLLQVSGRAGRALKEGKVIVQTRQIAHPLLQLLIRDGYAAFANHLLQEREMAVLPPYTYCAVFRAESYDEKNAQHFLSQIKSLNKAVTNLNFLGPTPALIAKRKGLFCQHLVLTANKRSTLQTMLKQILQQLEKLSTSSSVKWILDVDPLEVM